MLRRMLIIGVSSVILTLPGACDGDADPPATTDTVAQDTTTSDAGSDAASTAPTHGSSIGAILESTCAPCHAGGGSGAHNIATVAADAAKSAANPTCSDLTVAACAIQRIKNGSMPIGNVCTGDPAVDSGNAACLTQEQQDAVQAWVDAGAPE